MSADPQQAADAIDDMLAFHAEVRAQLNVLRRIETDLQDHSASSMAEARELAEHVLRIFGYRRILHERDEAESLLPRVEEALAARAELDGEIGRQLKGLVEEHAHWEAVWRPLQFWLWMVSADDPIATPQDMHQACETAAEHLVGHIEREEEYLYEPARLLLSPEDIAEVGAEMKARRGRFQRFGLSASIH